MNTTIRQAEFVKTITRPEQAPPAKPAVVFAGRSNVGKSSLLNRLVGMKSLARTSNTPGRTREINYFQIEEQYYFIDLPGYGYAKVSQTLHHTWRPMIERFFRLAEGLRLIVLILDIRRDPNPDDMQMIGWMEQRGIPFIFAVTKCDKLSRSQTLKRLTDLTRLLGLEDDSSLVPVSSQTGMGIEDLLRVIRTALEAPPPANPEIEPEPESERQDPN
jgi:GTP-binding protein